MRRVSVPRHQVEGPIARELLAVEVSEKAGHLVAEGEKSLRIVAADSVQGLDRDVVGDVTLRGRWLRCIRAGKHAVDVAALAGDPLGLLAANLESLDLDRVLL